MRLKDRLLFDKWRSTQHRRPKGQQQVFRANPALYKGRPRESQGGPVKELERAGRERRITQAHIIDKAWESVFANPQEWMDCRSMKARGSLPAEHPDFLHSGYGQGVLMDKRHDPPWLDARLAEKSQPDWMELTEQALEQLPGLAALSAEAMESPVNRTWSTLFFHEADWIDWRPHKHIGLRGPDHGDFQHDVNGEELFLSNARKPAWVDEVLAKADAEYPPKWTLGGNRYDRDWLRLLWRTDEFQDFRLEKESGKLVSAHPDFRHIESGRDLWVDAAPGWALDKLLELRPAVEQ